MMGGVARDPRTRGWLRGLAVTALAALFMAWVGAFDSGQTPLASRLAYWLALMLLGYVWGAWFTRWFFRRVGEARPLWFRVISAAVLLAIPFSGVVWFVSGRVFHSHIPFSALPRLLASVIAVALVMVTLNVLIARQSHDATERVAPPKFLERLPPRLRGAEIWAVEAEDHYLRLHTSKGQDLILMRLADAVAELEGIEGAQVHRSWWIARDGIADARRGDGRATLTLKDGALAPVSRTYAAELRERGWI